MSSPETPTDFDSEVIDALSGASIEALTNLAAGAIRDALLPQSAPNNSGRFLDLSELDHQGACFVTLRQGAALRGCIGTLEPHCSLREDVSRNAYFAAFEDPRFAPLQVSELGATHVSVSVLSPFEELSFRSEAALLELLVPGRHGLVIAHAQSRATYLPSVWEELPQPVAFLESLKDKAGISRDAPSSELRAWRYTTQHGNAVPITVEADNA